MGRDFFGKIPNGAPGIELRLALLHHFGVNKGKFNLQKLVEITSTNPAKIFGLYPHKGTIAMGGDADIVIFDPAAEITVSSDMLHENVDYTPYEGTRLTGYPVGTIANGQVIVEKGKFIGQVGAGKFIKRRSPQII
ncbi:dihydropyrimidinase, partial [bacterium]